MAATTSNSPCGACKFLRRKCVAECAFAPYFPPDQPLKFSNAHKIFGASNISKILSELPVHQRAAAVNSLAYEAQARMKDPVYGCVGAISYLKRHIEGLENELGAARAELARYVQQENTGSALLQHADQRRLAISLQTNPNDHTPTHMHITASGAAVDHYHQANLVVTQAQLHNKDTPISRAADQQIWMQQQPHLSHHLYHEAEFVDNSLEMPTSMAHGAAARMAAGAHFLHSTSMANSIDGMRSPIMQSSTTAGGRGHQSTAISNVSCTTLSSP